MKLKKLVKEAMRMIGFRVSETEYQVIEEKAKKFTEGNVSEWVRYASVNMEPKASEVTQ